MTYEQELLEKGRAEGRTEGRAEGRTEGRTEGRSEVRTEGRMQRDLEVVQGLLQAGVAWEVITTATGLTEADFEELKAQLADSDS